MNILAGILYLVVIALMFWIFKINAEYKKRITQVEYENIYLEVNKMQQFEKAFEAGIQFKTVIMANNNNKSIFGLDGYKVEEIPFETWYRTNILNHE